MPRDTRPPVPDEQRRRYGLGNQRQADRNAARNARLPRQRHRSSHPTPDPNTASWLSGELGDVFEHRRLKPLLVHLTLKGNFIYAAGNWTLNVDGETFGQLAEDGTLEARLPSGDGRRGGDLELWFWLTAGDAGATQRVTVAAHDKSPQLTRTVERDAVVQAIGLTVDRDELQAWLAADFRTSPAVVDPARAREIIEDARLAARTLTVAVDEQVRDAAAFIDRALEAAEFPIGLKLIATPDVVDNFQALRRSQGDLDLIIASDATIDRLASAHRGSVGRHRMTL